MVAKLKEAGVEAHTETRVHLGPFKSRAEADEATAKLKGLGFSPLLVPLSK
jgi:cell division protein FtsN